MTDSSSEPQAGVTAAQRQAQQNWAANLKALARLQPRLIEQVQPFPEQVEWVFGRDGSLTALDQGRWIAGTSLPGRAARAILKSMGIRGSVACFLAPTHAAQLRTALDLLESQQAVVAVVPDLPTLRLALGCEDFTADIEGHRLWLACGQDWGVHLQGIFTEQPGLPLPIHFIRLPKINDDVVNELIPLAQKLFSEQTASRAKLIESLRQSPPAATPSTRRLCVVAPSRFRLWEDAGAALAGVLGDSAFRASGIEVARLDPDDPASASPLALALAVRECDAVVAANTARCDIPQAVPAIVPWLTWVTTPRIPAPDPAAIHDQLLLADPAWQAAALGAGWPAQRVRVAGWPPTLGPQAPAPQTVAAGGGAGAQPWLAVVADMQTLEPPQEVKDLSSHRLLWEMIARELLGEPFSLTSDIERYLSERMQRQNVSEEGFDRAAFVHRLIVPAYQQGLVRLLLGEKLPVRLFGRGWDQIGEFRPHSAGAVGTRQQFAAIVSGATALVHVWPMLHAHPIDAVGRPVVRRRGQRHEPFLRDARLALQDKLPCAPAASSPLLSSGALVQCLPAV